LPSWPYRAIGMLNVDGGHQIGAVAASLPNRLEPYVFDVLGLKLGSEKSLGRVLRVSASSSTFIDRSKLGSLAETVDLSANEILR
jgi:hypothetical protein